MDSVCMYIITCCLLLIVMILALMFSRIKDLADDIQLIRIPALRPIEETDKANTDSESYFEAVGKEEAIKKINNKIEDFESIINGFYQTMNQHEEKIKDMEEKLNEIYIEE